MELKGGPLEIGESPRIRVRHKQTGEELIVLSGTQWYAQGIGPMDQDGCARVMDGNGEVRKILADRLEPI